MRRTLPFAPTVSLYWGVSRRSSRPLRILRVCKGRFVRPQKKQPRGCFFIANRIERSGCHATHGTTAFQAFGETMVERHHRRCVDVVTARAEDLVKLSQ